jgi:ABC-type sulfate transport system substrate-binding protein
MHSRNTDISSFFNSLGLIPAPWKNRFPRENSGFSPPGSEIF